MPEIQVVRDDIHEALNDGLLFEVSGQAELASAATYALMFTVGARHAPLSFRGALQWRDEHPVTRGFGLHWRHACVASGAQS